MSMTMTLVPIVIAIGSTVSTGSVAVMCRERTKSISKVPTQFADRELLLNTLNEHGLHPVEADGDHIIVTTPEGELHYERRNEEEPYMLSARNIRSMDRITDSLREFEEEYGRNVQAYTYNKIMRSLEEHGLALQSEEVSDDDSILLTLRL